MTESNDCFCWTKEPDEPPHFSDWRVTLEIEPSLSVTYAVHRVALASKIEYFKRIFLSSSPASNNINNDGVYFSEARDQHSKIALPQTLSDEGFFWTVEAFEILLAQCYRQKQLTENHASEIKDSRVFVAFYYLADYLQVKEGNMDFKVLEKRLCSGEAGKLYQGVLEFPKPCQLMKRIRYKISHFCAHTGPKSISSATELAAIADHPLWLAIVDLLNHREKMDNSVYEWSNNIAHFLARKNNTVTLEVFEKLTVGYLVGCIAPEAALLFLDMEQKFHKESKDGEITRGDVDDPMTNLQLRCAFSLITSDLEEPDQQNLKEKAIRVLAKYPPVLKFYLEKTLGFFEAAKRDLFEALKSKDQLVTEVQILRKKNPS